MNRAHQRHCATDKERFANSTVVGMKVPDSTLKNSTVPADVDAAMVLPSGENLAIHVRVVSTNVREEGRGEDC